jgi:hypothetical protein
MFGKNETGAENAAATGTKIDRETAENEFIRYCENNEIEYEESKMDDEEKESFNDIKERVIEACMEGRVETEGTSLKYTVSKFSPEGFRGETVVIKRPIGNAFSAMDGFSDKQNVHKLHAFMSALTGKDVKYFSKIDTKDWKFFQAVSSLFLSL